MDEYTVHHLFGIEGGGLLLILYSDRRGFEFRAVTPDGRVFGETSNYYTRKAALAEGRRCFGNPRAEKSRES